jgi:hypothetical protein
MLSAPYEAQAKEWLPGPARDNRQSRNEDLATRMNVPKEN